MDAPSRAPVETDPAVSVVVGASAPAQSLDQCLAALEPQRAGTQVIVVDARPTDPALRARFPWAEFYERPGALVPELWRDGIDRARGRIVALTISQMVPAPDWIEAIIREHERHDAVGGAIEVGPGLRWVDWAEYLCRYARDIPPFQPADRDDVAGDNASYKRALLVRERESLRGGFWEPVIHPVLRRQGVPLWHTPAVVVRQGRSGGFLAFARQRLRHGRLYPHQRGAEFTRVRHAIGVLASPVVPGLMTLRVIRHVLAKRRYRVRAVAALPLIFAFNTVWAFAEARGHLDLLRRR